MILRSRVVGLRVMLAGYDPYTFVWQPEMPEQWLDPVYDNVHRLTDIAADLAPLCPDKLPCPFACNGSSRLLPNGWR